MPFDANIEVKNLVETQRKMNQVARDLHGDPMVDAMQNATMIVTRDARLNAPVDTGRLRSSISPEVRTEGRNVVGIVGTVVDYAPYMELGTGIYAGNAPYFPPPSALETWARRHGTTGYNVAMAIFRAGGLKPRKFLQKAFEQNRDKIVRMIELGVRGIVNK